jgi:arylsulfatase A-like enzyme
VSVPGVTKAGLKSEALVNLLDMYPTLIELCGLPANPENEGRSFAPVLKDPTLAWNHPTLTTYNCGNHSVTDGRYRFTYYGAKGGAEELYDHSTDPLEHRNLASQPEYKEIIERLRLVMPKLNEPDSPVNNLSPEEKKEIAKGARKGKKAEANAVK